MSSSRMAQELREIKAQQQPQDPGSSPRPTPKLSDPALAQAEELERTQAAPRICESRVAGG
ncbi:MAG: hypothetical protein MZV65_18785 [Chromatiales bacterium]|nr:hypothetical protein [Chromatiales bacterium]